MAVLGEMTQTSTEGFIYLPKNTAQVDANGLSNAISYCAQTPCE
jgi:hypothetical protein